MEVYYFGNVIKQPLKNTNMKKVASILAVAIFTLGLTATAIADAPTLATPQEDNTEVACGGCSTSEDTRKKSSNGNT